MSSSPHKGDGDEGVIGVMTAGRSSGRLESELENVCRELNLVEAKVAELLEQQNSLRARRDQLSGEIRARKKRSEFLVEGCSSLQVTVVGQGQG